MSSVAYSLIIIILYSDGEVFDQQYQPYSYDACVQERDALIAWAEAKVKKKEISVHNIRCEKVS